MTEPTWQPGDLHDLFVKWVTDDEYKQYSPVVLSSPDSSKYGGQKDNGPWVIVFDTFLTDFEADQIYEGGKLAGFDRSTDQGQVNEFGEMEQVVSRTRTSSNAWCTDKCERLPGVISATKKIEAVTGVSGGSAHVDYTSTLQRLKVTSPLLLSLTNTHTFAHTLTHSIFSSISFFLILLDSQESLRKVRL